MRHALLFAAALLCLVACPEGCEGVTVTAVCGGDSQCQNDVLCDGRERCDPGHARADQYGCVARLTDCPRCTDAVFPSWTLISERPTSAATMDQEERLFDIECHDDARFGREPGEIDCTDPVTFDKLCGVEAVCTSPDECLDSVFCNGVEVCEPTREDADVFGCALGEPRCPGMRCDELLEECFTVCPVPEDDDGDGSIAIACGGDDCDDQDNSRFPGNPEVCDAADHDEDCDPATSGARDTDGDGFHDVICQNSEDGVVTSAGTDCDDTNAQVHPAAQELCNGIDDNCDGLVDDGVSVQLYPDLDHDGYGAPVAPVSGCLDDLDMSRYAGDCDDSNEQIFPGSIRCIAGGQGNEIEICQDDGTWLQKYCDGFTACVTQPGGHGVCM